MAACTNCKSSVCEEEAYRLNLQCLFQKLVITGNKLCIEGGNCVSLSEQDDTFTGLSSGNTLTITKPVSFGKVKVFRQGLFTKAYTESNGVYTFTTPFSGSETVTFLYFTT